MEEEIKRQAIVRLTNSEHDLVEELQRLDREVYGRDSKLGKDVILRKIIQLGIPALRRELMNEPE